MTRVGLINLGCPRNLVDSEVMLGLLQNKGFKVTEDFSRCDAAIINTCAFIEDAKKESIDLILQLVELKKENKIKSIIVTGCLPQRYSALLKKELKEIDGFVGTNDFIKIPEIVKKVLAGKKVSVISKEHSFLYDHTWPRALITPRHSVYLKISEGCNNNCSYCVIPKIRGKLRSRDISSILKEAKGLSRKNKISEINLIGQDITLYGADLPGGKPRLDELARRLAHLEIARWIRLLYTHPEHYTDNLIDVIKSETSICKYLDLPLQHINDRILKLMGRNTKKKDILDLIKRLRKEIPNLAIRTTFIVGFPGEGEEEFKELFNFIKDTKFERLGIFEFSKEEGTKAFNFEGQVPDKIKKERFDAIMKLQQDISKEINSNLFGKTLEVLIDEVGERDKLNKTYNYICRTAYDAPEVDGSCFVSSNKRHKPGDFINAKITGTMEYDLIGEET